MSILSDIRTSKWGSFTMPYAVWPYITWPSYTTVSYSPARPARSYPCGDSPDARSDSSNISASPASRRSPSSSSRHWRQNYRLEQRSARYYLIQRAFSRAALMFSTSRTSSKNRAVCWNSLLFENCPLGTSQNVRLLPKETNINAYLLGFP